VREQEREAVRGQRTLCELEAQCVSKPCTLKTGAVREQEVPMDERVSEAEILFCG
jgi:hypothetical protein